MRVIGSQKPHDDGAPCPGVDAMPELVTLKRSVQEYRAASQADNTRLAYGKQWEAFAAWCLSKAFCDLPAAPETVALYLAACADAGLAVATLAQAKAAISQRHEEAAQTSPCAAPLVKEAWAGPSFHSFAEEHASGYPSTIAHGYMPNHSILSNAHVHRGARMLLNADIRNFFPSITRTRLLGCLRSLGLTDAVASDLSDMVTIDGQLVLGLPPSPMFANLISVPLDGRLQELAEATQSSVTRYGDDIAFSGARIPTKRQVSDLLHAEGFELAEEKFRIKKRGQATFVTGLSVSHDKRPHVPRTFKRRLRQELYYCTKHTIAGHLDRCDTSSVNKLDGRIRFLRGIEPQLGHRMQKAWKALLHRDGMVVSYAPRNERQKRPLTLFVDETKRPNDHTLALICVEVENAAQVRKVLLELRDELVADVDTPRSRAVLQSKGLHFTELSPSSREQAYRKFAQLPCRAYVAFGELGADYAASYESVLQNLLVRRLKRADRRTLTIVCERDNEAKKAPQRAVTAAFAELDRTGDRRPPTEPSVVIAGKEDAGLWLADGLLYVLSQYALATHDSGAEHLATRNFERVRHVFRVIDDLRNGHEFTRRRPIAAGDLLQP